MYRGPFTVFFHSSRIWYSEFQLQLPESVLLADGVLSVQVGIVHQPAMEDSFRFIAGLDESAEPFLSSVHHDWVEKIVDGDGSVVWGC